MECFGVRWCEMWWQDSKGRAQELRRHVVLAGLPNIVPMWAVQVFWESVWSEPCHPREMGEVTPLKTEVWKHTHKFTSHTFYTTRAQRVSRSTILSTNVRSPKDGSNLKLPYKESSRGVTIKLLWHNNTLKIPIPDCSWKEVRIWFL